LKSCHSDLLENRQIIGVGIGVHLVAERLGYKRQAGENTPLQPLGLFP